MNCIKKSLPLLLAAALSVVAEAKNIYVCYESGKKGNPGTKEKPLPDFADAAKVVAPGDTIFILPVKFQIRDSLKIGNFMGTKEKPITVDGMNNIFVGTMPIEKAGWKKISKDIYSKKEALYKSWTGRFFMTIDGKSCRMGRFTKGGKPAPFKDPAKLAPGEWTIVDKGQVNGKHKELRHFEFFVRLPEGKKSAAEAKIEAPRITHTSGAQVYGKNSHVIIRNVIVKNFYNDGYNIHGECTDIHFENVAAVDCGDDGISAHEACTISVKNMVSLGNSTVFCHIQEAKCHHENLYGERTWGRDIFLLNSTSNTIKNCFIMADSADGFALYTGKRDSQTCSIDNLLMINRRKGSSFGKYINGKLDLKMSNVKISGFKTNFSAPGLKIVKPQEIEKDILAAKKRLYAIFKGKLENL